MYKILRIIFCVLCAILLAVCIPVFALFDWYWGVVTLISALIFFLLMLMFKGLQGDYERKHPSTVKENKSEQPEKVETAESGQAPASAPSDDIQKE